MGIGASLAVCGVPSAQSVGEPDSGIALECGLNVASTSSARMRSVKN